VGFHEPDASVLRMTRRRHDVIAAARRAFPASRLPSVLGLLDAYGVEAYERERERVQLAIIVLSEGNESKLPELVAIAKRDYRDVLFWAEYPEESRLDTPEKKRRMRELFEKLGIEPPPVLKE
jgi:hypothetical protein